MAANPYGFLAEDPYKNWAAQQAMQIPQFTYATATQSPTGAGTWGQLPNFTVPGNTYADGTPTQYPGAWGYTTAPTASPAWQYMQMPTQGSIPAPTAAPAPTTPTTPTATASGTPVRTVSAGRATTATATTPTRTAGTTPVGAVGTYNPAAMTTVPSTTTPTATTPTATTPGATLNPQVAARMGGGGTTQQTTPNMWNYWTLDDQGLKALQLYLTNAQAQTQLAENIYGSQRDFNEAQRRFDITQPWQMSLEQFNAQLASRQQSQAELSAASSAYQWGQEFTAQRANDTFAQDLANRELAAQISKTDRELTISERNQIWTEAYQRSQLEIQKQQIAANLESSRMAAFGRRSAPARWQGTWA